MKLVDIMHMQQLQHGIRKFKRGQKSVDNEKKKKKKKKNRESSAITKQNTKKLQGHYCPKCKIHSARVQEITLIGL